MKQYQANAINRIKILVLIFSLMISLSIINYFVEMIIIKLFIGIVMLFLLILVVSLTITKTYRQITVNQEIIYVTENFKVEKYIVSRVDIKKFIFTKLIIQTNQKRMILLKVDYPELFTIYQNLKEGIN